MRRKCPFCGSDMVQLKGADGAQMLFNDMIDPKGLGKTMAGALNRHPKTKYYQCPEVECGYLALFPPLASSAVARPPRTQI